MKSTNARKANSKAKSSGKAHGTKRNGKGNGKPCRMCAALREHEIFERVFEELEEQFPFFEFLIPDAEGLIAGKTIHFAILHDNELVPANGAFYVQILSVVEPLIEKLTAVGNFLRSSLKTEPPKQRARRLERLRAKSERDFEKRVERERKELQESDDSVDELLNKRAERKAVVYGGTRATSQAGK
jgi:hypothetical protein